MPEITLLETETGADPSYSVIWLHGLGADATDFQPIVPELGLAQTPALRFVFPNAPHRPVTCNGGYVMRAWYDIVSLAPDNRKIDENGLLESREIIRQLIGREIERGIPSHRVFLAGFSQGGAVAYLSGLTHPEALAGIIALSTYIPSSALLTRELTECNRSIPIFAAHGIRDDVVSITLGIKANELIQQLGYQSEWHTYEMPHSVCSDEIKAIGQWLNTKIATSEKQSAI